MKKEIVAAIIATSQEEMNKRIEKVKDAVSILQLDIMDGKFVKNKSIDFDFSVPKTDCEIEAHLMVKEPQKWIDKNAGKVDTILVHAETCDKVEAIIKLVRSKGKKIGAVLNPETPLEKIKDCLDEIDEVLIMTVHPGAYGAKFLPEMLKKVKELRKLCPNLNIEVDGGISADTIKQASDAGANLFVSGSYLQKAHEAKDAVARLKELIS